jgi:hypothetical protein
VNKSLHSLVVVLALMVSACISGSQVTPEHFAKANAECAEHGGLKVVSSADQQDESLSCGRYCDKPTGRTQYHAAFDCNDGTKMDVTWFK